MITKTRALSCGLYKVRSLIFRSETGSAYSFQYVLAETEQMVVDAFGHLPEVSIEFLGSGLSFIERIDIPAVLR